MQAQTPRSEKPEKTKVRVVTSTSVVTSRPVPLEDKFTFSFGENLDNTDVKLKQDESVNEVITSEDEKDVNIYYYYTEANSTTPILKKIKKEQVCIIFV